MTGKTKVLSVHKFRRVARRHERALQWTLAAVYGEPPNLPAVAADIQGLPDWARGVRVEKAGPFQWAVVATEAVGR